MRRVIVGFIGAAALVVAVSQAGAAQAVRVDIGVRLPPLAARIAYDSRTAHPVYQRLGSGWDVRPYDREYLRMLSRHDRELWLRWRQHEREYWKHVREAKREWLKDRREREREALQRQRELEREFRRWLREQERDRRGRPHGE